MSGDHVIGKDAKAYHNSGTNASPTWVLMDALGNLTTNLTKNEAALDTRETGWGMSGGGRKQGSVSFDYLHQVGTDAVFDALLDSFLNNTPIEFAFMDQLVATVGAQGLRAPMEVFTLDRAEELDSGIMYSVEAKVTRMVESGSVIVPSWMEVSA